MNELFDKRRTVGVLLVVVLPLVVLVGTMLGIAHASNLQTAVAVVILVVLVMPPVILFVVRRPPSDRSH